ncbi:MAG: hypothetical protein PHF37_00590 [Phycisphaerae bacterium]|nr:hypothetical protein [Phycisphaerae bacterium]
MGRDKKLKKGSVLVIAMTMMVMLLMIGTSLLFMSQIYMTFTQGQINKIIARTTADAGLTKALYQMNDKLLDKPWNDAELPSAENVTLPDCPGLYSYTIEPGDVSGRYLVTATGVCNEKEVTVVCTLKLTGMFGKGIVVVKKLEIKNNGVVKGYNSQDSEVVLVGVDVGTLSTGNDDIKIENNTIIEGNVFVGFGGDPDKVITGSGTIEGSTYALSQDIILSPVATPVLTGKGDLEISKNTTLTSADNGQYNKLKINNNKKLTIDGDVVLYITGKIEARNNTEIIVNADSSLVIYAGDDIKFENSAKINNIAKKPANFVIYGGTGSQEFEMKNTADFYGVIYAPNADVEFKNSLDMYGAVVSKSFTVKNNTDFYYDEALDMPSFNDNCISFRITGWYER